MMDRKWSHWIQSCTVLWLLGLLSTSVSAQTYDVQLNLTINGLPLAGAGNNVAVQPGDTLQVVMAPTLTITGGTAPSPDDLAIDVTYDTALLLDMTPLNTSNWACDASTPGLISCSLVNPSPFPNPIPQLAFNLAVPTSALAGAVYPSNSFTSSLFFVNGPPPGSTINDDNITTDVSVVVPVDLAVQLQPDANPVAVGAYSQLTVNWSNLSANPASNAVLTVNLPAQAQNIFVSNTNNPWSCTINATQVSCVKATVAAGDSGQFLITYNAPQSVGNWPVSANITSESTDTNTANDNASFTLTTQVPVNDLAVNASVSPGQALPGDTVRFSVTQSNIGNVTAYGFLRFSTQPAMPISGYVAPPGLTCAIALDGLDILCNDGNTGFARQGAGSGGVVPVGASYTFLIDVAISPSISVNQLVGTGYNYDVNSQSPGVNAYTDDNAANDSASATVLLGTPEADLQLEKTAEFTPPLAVGDTFQYRIRVQNLGPQAAGGVVIDDQLPSNVELISVDVPFGWSCTPSQGVGVQMQCAFNRSLSPPDSQTLVQHVRYLGPGETLDTSASVRSDADDPVMANNSVSRSDSIAGVRGVNLVLSQTLSTQQVPQQGVLTVTHVMQNTGTEDATGVRLEIQHGPLFTYMAKAGPDWGCTAAGYGTTICELGVPLPAAGSESLSLDFAAGNIDANVNLVGILDSDQPDLNAADNRQQTRITIGQGGSGEPFDLQLALLTDTPNPVSGQQFTLEAVLDNLGPGVAYGFVVDFALPQGLDLIQASGEGWSCAPLSKNGHYNQRCEYLGLLNPDGQSRILLDVEAQAATGTQLPVEAVASVPTGSELNAGNSMASLMLQVGRASFLTQTRVEGGADRDRVRSGEVITYALNVRNTGTSIIAGAYLEARLDGPARFLPEQTKQWGCDTVAGQLLRCELLTPLAPGQEEPLQFSARAQVQADRASIRMEATLVDADDPGNVSETLLVDVFYGGLSDEDLLRLLEDAAGDDEIATGSIGPIEEMCLAPSNEREQAFCDALFQALEQGRLGDVRSVLRAVNPRAVITQTSAMVEVSSAQFRNIDARMNELRAGTGGFSFNGLNLRYGDQSLRLASLRYLLSDSDSALRSGLASPWGFFVNGTISAGDRDPTTREIAFDFSSRGLTAGVDYRFTDRFVLGAALGYASFGSDDAQGGSMDTQGTTLTAYLSWYPRENWFVDARISQGWLDVEQKRAVTFSIGSVSQDVFMSGTTEATQNTLALASGLHYNRNGLVVTPNVSMRYMNTRVDGYEERALGLGAVRYSDFDFNSLELSTGLQMTKSISMARGVLTPQLDAAFRYETRNDGMVIEARLLGRQTPFLIRTDSPDRGYATLGGGMVYVSEGGKQFYFTYRQLLGLEGFSQYTLNLGLRMEF